MSMKNPPHPGEIVMYDCMEPKNLNIEQTAELLDMSSDDLLKFLDGTIPFTEEFAKKLEGEFGTSANVWLKMQKAYDDSITNIADDALKNIKDVILIIENNKSNDYSELDIYESLDLIEGVISGRLSTSWNEWAEDYLRKYTMLWNSIRKETKEVIILNFQEKKSDGSYEVSDFIKKFNLIVVPSLINSLKELGPAKSRLHLRDIIQRVRSEFSR